MAAEAQQRHADDRSDHGSDDGRSEDGDEGRDARVGSMKRCRRVEPNGEDRRRVGADEEERALAQRDLTREAHQQREADRDERV